MEQHKILDEEENRTTFHLDYTTRITLPKKLLTFRFFSSSFRDLILIK